MSNFNEYISKLECAMSLLTTIEQIKELLEKTEGEYRFWLRESRLPRWMYDLKSDGILNLKEGAYQKHYRREDLRSLK